MPFLWRFSETCGCHCHWLPDCLGWGRAATAGESAAGAASAAGAGAATAAGAASATPTGVAAAAAGACCG